VDVDIKSLTAKYSVPGPSSGTNSRVAMPHGIDRNGMSTRKTQSEAIITLCMHILYNGRWKNAQPNYFMKFLKNTKELLILVPTNKKQSAGKALSIIHRRQNENGNWKVYNRWLHKVRGGVKVGRESMIGEDLLRLYDGSFDG
jgi:hypothetical protein